MLLAVGFVFQCADDQDAVCTRSVTLSLPSLEDMTVKLKHGGVVSVNSMDIQTPMHHGMPLWKNSGKDLHFIVPLTILYCIWYHTDSKAWKYIRESTGNIMLQLIIF